MFFKHQYFTLDLDTRKVFDVNNKELRLTGNAYRVLLFLCENKSGTVTAVGDHLDWAKDYDENNLRQYRYKIETLIGYKVIEYKNGVYTLVGDVKKVEELANNERNTVLLRPSSVKSYHKFLIPMSRKAKMILLSILGAVILVGILHFYLRSVYAFKKSADGLCHERGTTYYDRTKNFTPFNTLEECLQSGGRKPKK